MTAQERTAAITWGGKPLPVETRAAIAAAIEAAVLEERERCAVIAEEFARPRPTEDSRGFRPHIGVDIAAAIREPKRG